MIALHCCCRVKLDYWWVDDGVPLKSPVSCTSKQANQFLERILTKRNMPAAPEIEKEAKGTPIKQRPCFDNHCENGGMCMEEKFQSNGEVLTHCYCRNGYTGTKCERKVNPDGQ